MTTASPDAAAWPAMPMKNWLPMLVAKIDAPTCYLPWGESVIIIRSSLLCILFSLKKMSIFKVQLQCKASLLIQWVRFITRWVISANSCVLFEKYIVCKQVEGLSRTMNQNYDYLHQAGRNADRNATGKRKYQYNSNWGLPHSKP